MNELDTNPSLYCRTCGNLIDPDAKRTRSGSDWYHCTCWTLMEKGYIFIRTEPRPVPIVSIAALLIMEEGL